MANPTIEVYATAAFSAAEYAAKTASEYVSAAEACNNAHTASNAARAVYDNAAWNARNAASLAIAARTAASNARKVFVEHQEAEQAEKAKDDAANAIDD